MPYDTEDELQEFHYTIPEGYEAVIEEGQVVIKKKAESEDERIRSWLYELVSCLTLEMNWKKSVLSWLEKQKPTEWSEEDEKMLDTIRDCICQQLDSRYDDWLKSIRPQPHK